MEMSFSLAWPVVVILFLLLVLLSLIIPALAIGLYLKFHELKKEHRRLTKEKDDLLSKQFL